jgi:hypothetical protein
VAPDRILVRPVPLHEGLADDCGELPVAVVGLADVTAPLDRNGHRLEESGCDKADRRDVAGAARVRRGVGVARDRHGPDAAAERRHRQKAHEAGRSHTRQRSNLLEDARVVRLTHVDAAVLRHRQIGPQGQHAVWFEAGIDALDRK